MTVSGKNETTGYYSRKIEPGVAIGSIGLRHEVELPNGYEYAKTLDATDVATLFRGHYPGLERFSPAVWRSGEAKEAHTGLSAIHVAVNESAGQLVGIGKLVYRGTYGCMTDFVVHTNHRSKGLGRAIIDEQLGLAVALDLSMIKIPRVETTNTLLPYYLEKGFVQRENGALDLRLADLEAAS